MRIAYQQTILLKNHALLVIFEKFEIVVCCKLYVALSGFKHLTAEFYEYSQLIFYVLIEQ